MEDDLKLGKCCICELENDSVRNMMTLDLKTLPGEKGGWGCFQCGKPAEGAVAVLCDECIDKYFVKKVEIKFACLGYPGENRRIEIEKLTESFEHDMSKHPEAEQEQIPINIIEPEDPRIEQSADCIQIAESLKIGENDYGYESGVCWFGNRWHGFALGSSGNEKMLFLLPECEDDRKTDRLIKLTGAVAQSYERGYGGIQRWFVEESLRGKPEDFMCEECGSVGCTPEYHGFY